MQGSLQMYFTDELETKNIQEFSQDVVYSA